jgi:hypothetical protein
MTAGKEGEYSHPITRSEAAFRGWFLNDRTEFMSHDERIMIGLAAKTTGDIAATNAAGGHSDERAVFLRGRGNRSIGHIGKLTVGFENKCFHRYLINSIR